MLPPAADWFAGQTAVVTGGARGIGRATAELLAALGARVVAVDNDEERLREIAAAGRCTAWPGDLGRDDAGQIAAEIWERHGPIQLLVNNVGIETPSAFLDLTRAEYDRVFDTNLRGPWFLTREIARRLVEDRLSGAVVFVSSLHDRFVRMRPHYSVSKAAVAMLVKELANELGPHGIRVNAVSPGRIRRGSKDDTTPAREAKGRRFVPLGRIGEPDDVARVVAVLLSGSWCGYVTGANVPVDGGLGLHSWSMDEDDSSAARGIAARLARSLRGGSG